jgi:hypothetical protein
VSNPNKVKGDAFERAVQDYLQANGFPWTEKTRAGYERDHGDLHLVPGRAVIAQAKNVRAWRLAEWIDQLAEQVTDAGADHGLLVVKRPKISDPGRSYTVMELSAAARLLRQAGYGTEWPEREVAG